ncbi:MAG: hypothetical protein ACJ77A_13520 [Actinomycetota bacterium]
MHVRLEPLKELVTGDLTVSLTVDVPTDRLVFRLWPNGRRQLDEGARLIAGPVTSSGRRLESELTDPTTLVVHPRAPLAWGDSITVSMPWRLHMPGPILDRLGNDGHTIRLGSFFPILAWVPGVGWATDPPTAMVAEASTSTTADFDVTVDAPNGSTVLASGVPHGDRWTAIAVRDFALAAGPFDVASGTVNAPDPVKVTMGVQDGVPIPARDALGRVERDLRDLAGRYGPYPWPELHVVITKDVGRAGIEYPTMIFEGSAEFARTASHEVSHQWFYSLVGNNQARDPWVDEALATWGGANEDGYLGYALSQAANGVGRNHVASPMTFWDQHQDAYATGVYWRGAQALAALGPPARVDCALRGYVATNAYRVATTQDLVDALTRVFPDAPEVLKPFGIPA